MGENAIADSYHPGAISLKTVGNLSSQTERREGESRSNNPDGTRKVSVCMLVPGAARHYRDFLFIPPEIEIAGRVSKFGHEVVWILASETAQELCRFDRGGIEVLVVPIKRGKGVRGSAGMILTNIKKVGVVLQLFRDRHFDIVHVRNDAMPDVLFNSLLALYLRRRYGTYLVAEIENPLEQSYVTWRMMGVGLGAHLLSARSQEILMRYVVMKADLVIATGQPLTEYLIAGGVDSSKVVNVPEGIDSEAFDLPESEEMAETIRIPDPILVYVGMMDRARGLELMINAFAKVRQRIPASLLMVGDGNDLKNLQRLAEELELSKDIQFTGWVPHEMVPKYIAAAQIGLSPIPPTDFFVKASPLKMLEYMAAGKPVVGNEEIIEQRIVASESCCATCVKYDADCFARAIIELLGDPEERAKKGQSGREWVQRERSYDALARKIEVKYQELVGRMETENQEPEHGE